MAKLNKDKLNKRVVAYTDMKTTLEDIAPMEWSPEVLSGEKKAVVKKTELENSRCVKLEISLS